MINTQDEALQWCIDQGVKVLFLKEPTAVQISTSDPYEEEKLGYGLTLLEAVQDAMRTIIQQETEEIVGDQAQMSDLAQGVQDIEEGKGLSWRTAKKKEEKPGRHTKNKGDIR